jgi:hypothetical protein
MKKTAWLVSILALGILTACSGSMSHQGHENIHHEMNNQGMDHMEQKQAMDVRTDWKFSPSKPKAGSPVRISVQVKNAAGQPVQDFDITHEKKMHLIVVSKDLNFFEHIHPEYKGNGLFQVETKLPAGGSYKLIADFTPHGSAPLTQTTWVEAAGAPAPAVPLTPDVSAEKTVDAQKVRLSFDKEPKAGEETMLTFTIRDAKTGKPVTDLQPYLGAIGHVVILSSDTNDYLHVHPMDEGSTGPDAHFHTTFPHPGVYKIWGQFQRQGRVFTVPFVVRVN